MSGFAAIVNLDGQPTDARLVTRMAAAIAFRGPDHQGIWCEGNVGLAHTGLQTDDVPAGLPQPFTLDGAIWIVADARIDGREDLVADLAASGRSADRNAADAELIVLAYSAWGESCAQRLLGDFAFVIWDGPRRRLVAARDQLGVKSLFYAVAGSTVIVSNTMDSVRLHPAVSDRLNDLAVADFLLFQLNHDPTTTVFDDVRRVPPAHTAVWSAQGSSVQRYWTLPVDEPVFYRRPADYTDRFNELMETAVGDRIRGHRVGIFLSGGIDSSAMAAVSQRVLQRRHVASGVRGFTTVVEGLDRNEGHFARLVANHLQIPITLHDGGESAFDRDWTTRRLHTPEPIREVTTLLEDRRSYQEMARFSPVAFYGEGPDNALQYQWQAYFRYLRRGRRYLRLASDVARHVRRHRRLPLQSLASRLLRARRDRGRWDVPYPGGSTRTSNDASTCELGGSVSLTFSRRPSSIPYVPRHPRRSAVPSGNGCSEASTPRKPARRSRCAIPIWTCG